ncbi:hypothetical protein SISNIDRAFT_482961 [Sistotremastrum niveocremeum HHB9708]|uniref:Uncharacterized protein n=2 Tax=Sistotremastraceae TaxID=3402574 RepID=A0A164XXK5_9AGAM|nr:hypothetical protein SISNIDRAFT_482961 [Sistotremastrum niveocremeum HHB9708]KZT35340.1 hypothetical protein SISSUDRAFT_1064580 [Sistotremastrum suecicum HHB10207 ss-3]
MSMIPGSGPRFAGVSMVISLVLPELIHTYLLKQICEITNVAYVVTRRYSGQSNGAERGRTDENGKGWCVLALEVKQGVWQTNGIHECSGLTGSLMVQPSQCASIYIFTPLNCFPWPSENALLAAVIVRPHWGIFPCDRQSNMFLPPLKHADQNFHVLRLHVLGTECRYSAPTWFRPKVLDALIEIRFHKNIAHFRPQNSITRGILYPFE